MTKRIENMETTNSQDFPTKSLNKDNSKSRYRPVSASTKSVIPTKAKTQIREATEGVKQFKRQAITKLSQTTDGIVNQRKNSNNNNDFNVELLTRSANGEINRNPIIMMPDHDQNLPSYNNNNDYDDNEDDHIPIRHSSASPMRSAVANSTSKRQPVKVNKLSFICFT